MKLKTSWHFTKSDGLNIVFVIQYIQYFNNFCGSANILLHIPLKLKNKMKKILSRIYSLRLNNIVWFLTWGLLFWFFIYLFIYLFISNGHIYKVAQKLPNIKKIYAENDNTVSTLSNVVQINLEIGNVDSTLFNVVNFNIDVHNVVSTLIWSWATSRRHISLNVTLKRRWNVCWEVTLINFSKKKKKKKNALGQFVQKFFKLVF